MAKRAKTRRRATESDRRTDAWDRALSEEQRWAAYDKAKQHRGKYESWAAWLREEYGIEPPGRSSFYRWRAYMRSQESTHRIETALGVKKDVRREMEQVGDIDEELIYAWTQLAMDSALNGDVKAGDKYLTMAMKLRDRALEEQKVEISKGKLDTSKEALDLMREKFEEQKRRNNEARAKLEQVKNTSGGLSQEVRDEIEQALNLL